MKTKLKKQCLADRAWRTFVATRWAGAIALGVVLSMLSFLTYNVQADTLIFVQNGSPDRIALKEPVTFRGLTPIGEVTKVNENLWVYTFEEPSTPTQIEYDVSFSDGYSWRRNPATINPGYWYILLLYKYDYEGRFHYRYSQFGLLQISPPSGGGGGSF